MIDQLSPIGNRRPDELEKLHALHLSYLRKTSMALFVLETPSDKSYCINNEKLHLALLDVLELCTRFAMNGMRLSNNDRSDINRISLVATFLTKN